MSSLQADDQRPTAQSSSYNIFLSIIKSTHLDMPPFPAPHRRSDIHHYPQFLKLRPAQWYHKDLTQSYPTPPSNTGLSKTTNMQPEEKLDRTGRPTGLPRYTTVDIDRRPSMYVDDPGNHFLSRFDPIRDLLSGSLNRLSKTTRGHVVACIGEFIGTILFFFLAFAAAEVATISTRNNAGDAADSRPTQLGTDQLLYMSLAFGFSLAVTAWTFFRISGGLFNPAVGRVFG